MKRRYLLPIGIILMTPAAIWASTAAGQSGQASAQSGTASGAGGASVAHGSASVIVPASAAIAVPLWLAGSSATLVGASAMVTAEGVWDAASGAPEQRPQLDRTICRPAANTITKEANGAASFMSTDPDPRAKMRQTTQSADASPAEAMGR